MLARLLLLGALAAATMLASPCAAQEGEAVLAGAPAVAEPPEEARVRYDRGVALFEEGNYTAALTEFQRAYEVFGDHPNRGLLLYNIGRCYEAGFAYDRALRFYERYRDAGVGDPESRAEVEERIRSVRERLASVRVDANLPEVEVWVDGRPIGHAPGELVVPAGEHVIEARAPGYAPARREIQLPAQSVVDVRLELTRSEGLTALHPAIALSTLGASLVVLGVGTGIGLDALSAHNGLSRRLASDTERYEVTQGEIDRVGVLATSADVLFATGALLGATAIVLLLFTDWDGEDRPGGLAIAPWIGGGDGGLWLAGSWDGGSL